MFKWFPGQWSLPQVADELNPLPGGAAGQRLWGGQALGMWCVGNETLFMVLSLPSLFVLSTEVSFFFSSLFPRKLIGSVCCKWCPDYAASRRNGGRAGQSCGKFLRKLNYLLEQLRFTSVFCLSSRYSRCRLICKTAKGLLAMSEYGTTQWAGNAWDHFLPCLSYRWTETITRVKSKDCRWKASALRQNIIVSLWVSDINRFT